MSDEVLSRAVTIFVWGSPRRRSWPSTDPAAVRTEFASEGNDLLDRIAEVLAVADEVVPNWQVDDAFSGLARGYRWLLTRALRWAWRIGKNLLGVVLVVAGIIMSIPGVPGQGILTMLLGVMLLDFPGKRPCEQWLVKRRRVRSAIDRVRARFGKPPLVLDE